jgi:hypothetical protein
MLEKEIEMNKTIAHLLYGLRSEWNSWFILYSFLIHLKDMNFYEWMYEERESCMSKSAPSLGDTPEECSESIERIGRPSGAATRKSGVRVGNDNSVIRYRSMSLESGSQAVASGFEREGGAASLTSDPVEPEFSEYAIPAMPRRRDAA